MLILSMAILLSSDHREQQRTVILLWLWLMVTRLSSVFFQESGGQIRLQPENSSMNPIILTPEDGEVAVIGKVTGLIRRMGGLS